MKFVKIIEASVFTIILTLVQINQPENLIQIIQNIYAYLRKLGPRKLGYSVQHQTPRRLPTYLQHSLFVPNTPKTYEVVSGGAHCNSSYRVTQQYRDTFSLFA